VLVNELAPGSAQFRPLEHRRRRVSQFEQLVRAICDLPLGDTTPTAPARMRNLLGHDVHACPRSSPTPPPASTSTERKT
jgi:5-(carboxyamino)imidazole ribonucleotide synthase